MSVYSPILSHWRRVITRPFEHAVAVLLIYSGFLRLFGGGTLLMSALIPPLVVAWSFIGILAGILILAGLHAHSGIAGRAMERVGWTFSLLALLATPAILLFLLPVGTVINGMIGVILPGIAALFRIWFLREEQCAERKMAKALSDAKQRDERKPL